MASLHNSTTLSNITTGILMPQLSHQWKVKFNTNPSYFSDTQRDIFLAQIIECSFDYHHKTISFTLEQDKHSTELHTMIKKFSDLSKRDASTNKFSFIIDMLDGTNTVLKSFSFNECALVGHTFDLNYADSSVVKHKINFAYRITEEL